jgi:hypothetical protein
VLRAIALVATVAGAGPLACGDLGEPAFEGEDSGFPLDVGAPVFVPTDGAVEGPMEEATVRLQGSVLDPAGKPIEMALVAIEVGGLNQVDPGAVGPEGGLVATLKIDPYYRFGAVSVKTGKFSLLVPDETLGVHVYTSGFYCGVPDAGAIPAEAGIITVRPEPLPVVDGSPIARPTITGFTVSPQVASPGEVVTMTALVEAADPKNDPLSEQVLAVEPTSNFAGIFAPPVPGTPGKGYPNGVYGRLVTAPLAPGEYTFYMVAATQACVVSLAATQKLLVTPEGDGSFDAGAPGIDAGDGGDGD